MRKLLAFLIVTLLVAACDVPQEIQSTPSNNTNTTGTTGSAQATEKPSIVGTGTSKIPDSLTRKRDSLPK